MMLNQYLGPIRSRVMRLESGVGLAFLYPTITAPRALTNISR
jgi:hypothetical protein